MEQNLPQMLRTLVTEYSGFLQAEKGMAPGSQRVYLRAVNEFLQVARGQPEKLFLPTDWTLNDLDKRALETYLNHLALERGWKPATLALQATALRDFFNCLQRRGHLERNPARSLKPRLPPSNPPPPEGEEGAVLSLFEREGESLAGARVLLLLELLYGAALQSSQAYAVKSLKVNGRTRMASIQIPGQAIEASLSPAGIERARRYLALRREAVGKRRNAPFWVNPGGGACGPAVLAREIKREMERAGLTPRPSLLRQLAARHFAERGADTRSVRQLLRAKRLGSLDRYAPPDIQRVLRQFREIHPRQGTGD